MARRLLWPAGIALGLLAERASGGLDDLRHALPDLLTGWTVLACGLVAWSRRPGSMAGPLLAATGATWFAGNFAVAALYVHRGPLVHLLLTYPDGRARSRTDRTAIAAGYAAALVLPVWASEPATLGLSLALLLAAARGYRLAVGPARRARALSLAVTAAFATVLAAGAAARLVLPAGEADEPAVLAYEAVLCAASVALAAGVAARLGERSALTDLVVELGGAPSGTLRDALADALGDPTLEVGYWMPETQAYADAQGHVVALPRTDAGRAVTLVERDGVALAALVHDPAVLDDPLLVESVAAAARLAASNARLQASVRAQIAELEASRRRLLAAGDQERDRLQQRLRAGAEQRLAALAVILEQAASRPDARPAARLARAGNLLARTREDLRELARGLHPASLAEAGLAGALAELADANSVPVALAVPGDRLDPKVEAVAYFVCAEALANVTKYASATHVTIAVRRRAGFVSVEISDDGVGGADMARGTGLRGLRDRLEASGGQLRIDSPPSGGTHLAAEIPLGGEAR